VRKSRYSDEQIAATLRQAEIGTTVAEIARKLGISEATFYAWKKRSEASYARNPRAAPAPRRKRAPQDARRRSHARSQCASGRH
jgi:transposase-like protein